MKKFLEFKMFFGAIFTGGATGIIDPGHHSVRVRLLWRASGQVGFSDFFRILPRGEGGLWVPKTSSAGLRLQK